MNNSRYAFFLGCMIPNRYPNIELSIRNSMANLGVELVDMNGASCCPAPGAIRSFSNRFWLAAAARNISIAEEMGLDIVTGCNGCYGTLKEANKTLRQSEAKKEWVNKILKEAGAKEYRGTIEIKQLVEALYADVGTQRISELIENPRPLRAAVHYGCHIVKPTELRRWGATENPRFLDELVEATGARSVEYKDKQMCCGAGGGVRSSNLVVAIDMIREKLRNIKAANVDCIVDCCPFCHMQLEGGQLEIKKQFGEDFSIPVLYYTQLLGLAIGLSKEELGVHKNAISANQLLERFGY
jgi:heterodisulfide reductase subunit B